MYDYRVVTVDRVVDLGFRIHTAQPIRLLGVDTPERGQDGWKEATAFTKGWLDDRAGRLRITSFKADSFGRYLGDIYTANTDQHLGAALLESGHAKVYVR